MRRPSSALGIAVVSTLLACHVEGDSAVDEVLRLEHETFGAIARKDAQRLAALLSDEFLYRSPGSRDIRKPEFLQNVAAIPVEIVSVEGEQLHAAVFGEAVVVTGVQRATTRAPDGSLVTGRTAFTDVFERQDGAWRLVLAYGIELSGTDPHAH
jgi:uncharacterized protein (TIGR02246 family)